MVRGRMGAILAATVLLGGVLALAPAAPARAAGPCGDSEAKPGTVIREVPWHQKWLTPERVWPFATGAGQTVAVLDTGVDGTHPQLTGQVQAGFDLLLNKDNAANVDCISHGTAVASLIAARKSDDVGFHGLAPDARILPVRLSNVDPASDPDGPKQPTAAMVARAITWAATHGATVIDVSSALTGPDLQLQEAVRQAVAAGIVVVAAAGDQRDTNLAADPPTYPAAYDGVLGVGSVDQGYARSGNSNIGPYVQVMAPGDGTVAATRISGYQLWTGTSIAAATVAATAALVRQAWPKLAPRDVVKRILATADPTPGGQHGIAYGHGIVDPYRAVTEQLGHRVPAGVPEFTPPSSGTAGTGHADWWDRTAKIAVVAAGSAAFLMLVVAAAAVVVPKGRRRRWRPTRSPRPMDRPETPVDDDSDGQPFAVPKPH